MNYTELLDNVRNYTEVTSDVLSNSVVNVFITNIENQIDRLVDTDAQRRYANRDKQEQTHCSKQYICVNGS